MLALRQPGDLSRVILALQSVTDGMYSRPTVTGNPINGRKGMGGSCYIQYIKYCGIYEVPGWP